MNTKRAPLTCAEKKKINIKIPFLWNYIYMLAWFWWYVYIYFDYSFFFLFTHAYVDGKKKHAANTWKIYQVRRRLSLSFPINKCVLARMLATTLCLRYISATTTTTRNNKQVKTKLNRSLPHSSLFHKIFLLRCALLGTHARSYRCFISSSTCALAYLNVAVLRIHFLNNKKVNIYIQGGDEFFLA